MSPLEIIVVIVCLAVGYWYISMLIDNRNREERGNNPPPEYTRGTNTEERSYAHGERDSHPGQQGGKGSTWHEVLGVAPDASHEQIVAAYRTRIRQYHPDKVSTLGSDIQALAEQRAKEINAAYAQACHERPIAD